VSDKPIPEYLTLKEAARHYKLSVPTLQRHCRLSESHPLHLKHIEVLGEYRVHPEDMDDWIRRKNEDRARKRRQKRKPDMEL
jgi:hypothetical protein